MTREGKALSVRAWDDVYPLGGVYAFLYEVMFASFFNN